VHQPALHESVEDWCEQLRLATTDRAHVQAKKELAAALFALHLAIGQAPVGGAANGVVH
jgi:hypothetical protein